MAVPDPSASCKHKKDTILNYYKLPLPSESPVAAPGEGTEGPCPPPQPCKISHKKDGYQMRPHRFHVSRPTPPHPPQPPHIPTQPLDPLLVTPTKFTSVCNYVCRLNFASIVFDNTCPQMSSDWESMAHLTSLNKCWWPQNLFHLTHFNVWLRPFN